jgi:hypothetical protein
MATNDPNGTADAVTTVILQDDLIDRGNELRRQAEAQRQRLLEQRQRQLLAQQQAELRERELAELRDRVATALTEAIDVLQSDGFAYAYRYAATLTMPAPKGKPGGAPKNPVGMPLPVARLIRGLVMEELHVR